MSRLLFGTVVAAVALAPACALAEVKATVEVTRPNVPSSVTVGERVTIGGFASVTIANDSNRVAIVSYSVRITDSSGKLNLRDSSTVCLVSPHGKKYFRVSGPRVLSYDLPGPVTVTCAASVSAYGVDKKDSLSTSFEVKPK